MTNKSRNRYSTPPVIRELNTEIKISLKIHFISYGFFFGHMACGIFVPQSGIEP